jgi:hypothetical protein
MTLFKKRPPNFSQAGSKAKFLQEWVAGVLQEAGVSPDHPAAEDLANLAANGIVRSCLKSVGEAYHDHGVVTYLEGLDGDRMSWRVDEIYNATIEMATAGRPGPVLRERISAFDRKLNETFVEIRPNYVNIVQVNSAHLSEALRAMSRAG